MILPGEVIHLQAGTQKQMEQEPGGIGQTEVLIGLETILLLIRRFMPSGSQRILIIMLFSGSRKQQMRQV